MTHVAFPAPVIGSSVAGGVSQRELSLNRRRGHDIWPQPLTATKTDPPVGPIGLIARPHLIDRLLSSEGQAEGEPRPFAFLRLESEDDVPRAFWVVPQLHGLRGALRGLQTGDYALRDGAAQGAQS